MSPELEKILYDDFNSLFANRDNRHSPMVFGIECGDGWHNIIRAACKEIAEHECLQPFVFSQVKEKFGTLRLYHDGGDSFCDGVVEMAEAMSAVTCERCGSPGTPNDAGWISTLCEGCRK